MKKSATGEKRSSEKKKKRKKDRENGLANGDTNDVDSDSSVEKLSPEAIEGAFENFKISGQTVEKLKGLYSTAQRRCPLTRHSELARALIVNI